MNPNLTKIKKEIYDRCSFTMSDLKAETESKEYEACQFVLNGRKVICRTAKITPTKVGQFVTFWKRNRTSSIEPFSDHDPIDFYVVNLRKDDQLGQFVFPKSILIQTGILSTHQKEGKRGFRVYPPWDKTNSKQAEKSQKWQVNFFYEIDQDTNTHRVKELFKME